MYVSMHVCLYVCFCVCMYVCINVSMYACTRLGMCVCMFACNYVLMYVDVCIFICIYACSYEFTHVSMYVSRNSVQQLTPEPVSPTITHKPWTHDELNLPTITVSTRSALFNYTSEERPQHHIAAVAKWRCMSSFGVKSKRVPDVERDIDCWHIGKSDNIQMSFVDLSRAVCLSQSALLFPLSLIIMAYSCFGQTADSKQQTAVKNSSYLK